MNGRLTESELLKKIAQNKLLNEALWKAAHDSNPSEIAKQMYNGANPNIEITLDPKYRYPLHIALAKNHNECVYQLLICGANPLQPLEKPSKGAPVHLPEELCDPNNQLAKDYLSASTELHAAMELFDKSDSTIMTAIAKFNLALSIHSGFTIDFLAKLAETVNLNETGGYYFDKMHHPAFVSFAIKQLILVMQVQPSFVTLALQAPLKNLYMSLEGYDPIHYGKKTHRLFANLAEKFLLLEYFETATNSSATKTSYKEGKVFKGKINFFSRIKSKDDEQESLCVRALTLAV